VPLQLDTQGPEWRDWAGKFKHEGSSIPIIFVIRADGESLYAKSGTKEGAELPRFLVEVRKLAGAALNSKQFKDLSAALEKAKKAHEDGDQAIAVREIGKFANTTSYAAVVKEGKEFATTLLEEAKAELEKAEQQLASSEDELLGAVSVLRIQRTFQPFKDVVKTALQLRSKFQKEKKQVMAQAELIDAAAKLEEIKSYDRATKAYQLVAQKFPNSPAAELAKERMEKMEEAKSERGAKKAGAKKDDP
jgi:hypothetical protein